MQELRDTNAFLKKEVTKLTAEIRDLTSNVSVLNEIVSEKDREIDRKGEMIRCKKTEVKVCAPSCAIVALLVVVRLLKL